MDKREKDNIIVQVAKWGLLCLVCIMFAFLSWNSLQYISYVGADYANRIIVAQDSILRNILAFGVIFTLLIVFGFWLDRILTEKVLKYLSFAAGVTAVAISVWWAFASCTKPEGDQLIVSVAAEQAMQNHYEMLTTGGYLHYYPQQLGLILFLELIFRLFGTFQFGPIYIIFGLMNGATILFGYNFLKEADFSKTTRFVYLIFMSVCLAVFFLYAVCIWGHSCCLFSNAFALVHDKMGKNREISFPCFGMYSSNKCGADSEKQLDSNMWCSDRNVVNNA